MATNKPGKAASVGRLIGYARVSTDEPDTDPQLDELRAASAHPVSEITATACLLCLAFDTRVLRKVRFVMMGKFIANQDALLKNMVSFRVLLWPTMQSDGSGHTT